MTHVALRSAGTAVAINGISLCTGGGGLDRALELACSTARSVVCVERESFSVANLVAQMQAGAMAPAPVWSNVRTFNGRRWRGVVDFLIGGIPCQPHSQAGRRQGSKDERDLWSDTRRIIVQARPWLVVIENVGGMLTAGADEIPGAKRVWRDLRKLGYQVEIVGVRASEVGLPHERFRIFVVAVNDQLADAQGFGGVEGQLPIGTRAPLTWVEGDSYILADAAGLRLEGAGPAQSPTGRGRRSTDPGITLGDAQGDGRREGRPEPSVRRGRRAAAGDGGAGIMGNAPRGDEPRPWQPEAYQGAREGVHRGSNGSVVDAGRCGRPGRAQGALGQAQQRTSDEWPGGRPCLVPAGPGDVEFWRRIAVVAPRLLPAVSRYDLLRLEMGAQGIVAAGDPSAGAWVDAQTGARMDPAVIQEAAQSALRGVDDVLAGRIDELRMLGNGVADAQGALALRIAAHSLARRSAGAAHLVRLMEAA